MRVFLSRIAALALVGALGLAVGNAQAASIAVVDEGGGVFSYELILGPGEVVAGLQLDLITDGASVSVGDTGFAARVQGIADPIIGANPWNLTSSVAVVASGDVRIAHTYDQGGNSAAGISDTYIIAPDGTQETYRDFIQGELGPFAPPLETDYNPMGIPIARLTVSAGDAPFRWTAGLCPAAAGSTCDFPTDGPGGGDVPEPAAAVLLGLGLAGLGLIRRR